MRRKLIFLFLFFHNYIYIYSKGRFGKIISGRPCLILESVGAKTQITRKNVLVFLQEDNNICIIASKGGSETNPGWYHNLKTNPLATVKIGKRRFSVMAKEIYDEERLEWWSKMDYLNKGGYQRYQKRTNRKIPVMILSIT